MSESRALWECLMLSGADVSDYAHETQSVKGRHFGAREFAKHGSPGEVVEAVRDLRESYDEALAEIKLDTALRDAAEAVVDDFGWSESSGFGLKIAALREALVGGE